MMGPAHSLSGAVAWLGVAAVAAANDHPMPLLVVIVGAVICAGAALAPDLDHKSATISRAFGPISKLACSVTENFAAAVYKATRGKKDSRREGGHRTLTHTVWWAAIVGGAVYALSYAGRWAMLAVFFVHLVLAVEGLLWRWARKSHDVLVWLLSAAVAWIVYEQLGARQPAWLFEQPFGWICLPVALGVLIHSIGDSLTVSGAPLLWPLPIGGKRWYPVGPPEFARFRAGGRVENAIVLPLLLVLGGAAGFGAFYWA
jgi:membrane-bound metal-dependent hydrolase YbcI (DUF457 family)